MSNKAVFLDLQGTLGGDGLGDIMDFKFFPYSIEAIKLLNDNNILAIVVTNQSHISKGLFTTMDFNNRFEALKVELSSKKTHIDLTESYVIGDMGASDMVMANKAGAKGILVRTGVGEGSLTEFRNDWSEIEPDYVADNVLQAVKWVLEK